LRQGAVLLAPADHHLLVADDRVRLSRGPRVNRQRPAVDTLFRSAALARGSGVVAVVLSGALDDGAVGAATVAAQDGVVLVQDPAEARVPSMPAAALASVRRARSVPTAELPAAVAEVVSGPAATPPTPTEPSIRRSPAMLGGPTERTDLGTPAALGCPECQGGMFESATEGTVSYACHVGHTWSAQTLLEAEQQAVEGAIYNAASKLMEMAAVHRRLAELAQDEHRERHQRDADATEARAARIQELAMEDPGPADLPADTP
jgi:two-component system chemotaxis response regulator CheB